MRITMRDIAERCGVSRPTVNLILNDRGHAYSAETRRRVLAAAKELGYRRNSSARAVQSGRFFGIGLLLSPTSELGGIPAGFLTSVEQHANQRGYHLTIGHVPSVNPMSSSRMLPKLLTESLVDGLLVYGSHELPVELREMVLSTTGSPVVWIGEPHETNAIWANEPKATRELVLKMHALGHRRVTYVGPLGWTSFEARVRRESYVNAMHELGLQPHAADIRPPTDGMRRNIDARVLESEVIFEAARTLLQSDDRPTAIVACSRWEAMAIQSTAWRLGWSLPRDLSLVTFDDYVVNISGQPISGMLFSTSTLGSAAIDMLVSRIESRGEDQPGVVLDYRWVEGCTIAPPRRR